MFHQDLNIAVRKKIDTSGYVGWSEESGIVHVIPPVDVLAKMIFIRIHLDDFNDKNGSIWAIPGSQKNGIINMNSIQDIVRSRKIFD